MRFQLWIARLHSQDQLRLGKVWSSMDIVTKEKRSDMMRAIHAKNTKPELVLLGILRSLNLRCRRQINSLPGRPDFLLPDRRTVLFVHGCFWHQHRNCPAGRLPKSNIRFWESKLKNNVRRDANQVQHLIKLGYRVITIWECELDAPGRIIKRIEGTTSRS